MNTSNSNLRPSLFVLSVVLAGSVSLPSAARADEPTPPPAPPTPAASSTVTPAVPAPTPTAPTPTAPAVTPTPTPTPEAAAKVPEFQSSTSEKRTESLKPKPVYMPSTLNGARMQADPIADGAVLGISAGFAILSDMIISTGELRPQQISPTFNTSHLLGIDRSAVTQTVDSHASMLSNLGLYAALSYTAIDSVATGFREDSRQSALVDIIIYGEVLALTTGVTNLAKMAVRRPRPVAYIEFAAALRRGEKDYSNADTDSSLSFFSGHAATVGSVAGAATYLAFTRSPHSIRPWLTLAGGLALTSFVSVERVRAGAHFPTDVIAGAVAGAGIGVLTAHIHREDTAKQRPVWIGFSQGLGTGGVLTLNGLL